MSQRFLNLIRNGESADVAALVEEDKSLVSCRDAQGVSALLWAVYSGQPVIRDFLLSRLQELDLFEASAVGDCGRLQTLLHHDATWVYQTSADGWSALHLAAAFGGPSAVSLLLEHGSHVHQVSRNPMHNQALHACIALSRNLETIRLLIEHGADVNAAQAGGFTPLHQAAAAGARDIVLLLLHAGADSATLCDQGKTAADYAQDRGHSALAQLLSEKQESRPLR